MPLDDRLKPIRGAAGLVRKLEKKREQLGKLRDALRELEEEYATLADSIDGAEAAGVLERCRWEDVSR